MLHAQDGRVGEGDAAPRVLVLSDRAVQIFGRMHPPRILVRSCYEELDKFLEWAFSTQQGYPCFSGVVCSGTNGIGKSFAGLYLARSCVRRGVPVLHIQGDRKLVLVNENGIKVLQDGGKHNLFASLESGASEVSDAGVKA